jgi:hypothetical protein
VRGLGRMRRTREQPGFGQQIEGPPDLIEVVADVSGEARGGQQRARMTMKKQQQIELARVTQDMDRAQERVNPRPAFHVAAFRKCSGTACILRLFHTSSTLQSACSAAHSRALFEVAYRSCGSAAALHRLAVFAIPFDG